jgi:hypothetical protein
MGIFFSEITPVDHELYSQETKDVVSEKQEIVGGVRKAC